MCLVTAFTTLAFLVHLLEEQSWIKSRSPVVGAVQIINQWIGEREIDGTINFTENAILGISSLIQTNSIYGGLDERLIFEHKPITENTHDEGRDFVSSLRSIRRLSLGLSYQLFYQKEWSG